MVVLDLTISATFAIARCAGKNYQRKTHDMVETELFDFGAAAREAVQKAVDEIMPKLKEDISMFKDRIETQPPFGSIGDSVDLADEWLKQHASTTPVTTIPESINQQYCGQRLPCGICRMTMTQCPMQVVTWSTQTGTTGTVK